MTEFKNFIKSKKLVFLFNININIKATKFLTFKTRIVFGHIISWLWDLSIMDHPVTLLE